MSTNISSELRWRGALAATAGGFAVLLPEPWRTLGLTVAGFGWLATRPGRRRLAVAAPLFLIAIGLGVAGLGWSGPKVSNAVRNAAENGAGAAGAPESLLAELDAEAVELAASLRPVGPDRQDRIAAFRTLEERASRSKRPQWSWLLVDPDGVAVAWAGRGLVHELDPSELPTTGRVKKGGYTEQTWASVRPVEVGSRPWRLVVGSSIESTRAAGARAGGETSPGSWSGFLVAAALLLLALFGIGDLDSFSDPQGRGRLARSALLTAGAVVALGAALGLPLEIQLALVLSLVALFLVGPRLRARSRAVSVLQAIATVAVLSLSAVVLQGQLGPLDLGSRFVGDWTEFFVRLALFLTALGLLPVHREDGPEQESGGRWALVAFAALLSGAALHAFPIAGMTLLVLGAGAAGLALRKPSALDLRRVLFAGLLAALSWEIAFHVSVDRSLERAVAVDLAPPSEAELDRELSRLEAYFETVTWDPVLDPEGRDVGDLAFATWRDSPLAERRGLSAVVIERDLTPVSIFSFGLPMTEDGTLNEGAGLRDPLTLPGWERTLVEGAAPMRFDDGSQGLVRYYFLPRPGFRTASTDSAGLAAGLLRDDPELAVSRPLLPSGAMFGFYDSDGAVLVPPWKGAGNLDIAADGTPAGRYEAGGLAATVLAVRSDAGWRAVFLPTPSLVSGFERVATHALSPLLVVFFASLLSLALSRTPAELRQAIAGSWSSYSRRMLVFATLLLLVPVMLLSGFVLRMVGERVLDQQLAAGQAALESAQLVLGDYVLALDPGFGIETTLDDELLIWLSDAVHHEVNLYWGSQLYASSKRELFSAGILPERIPGEIYSRLALGGAGVASRTSTVRGSEYREFYAPLRVPGVPTDAIQLFLSMPLLAQEEEAAMDIATLRRRVLIVAIVTALFLIAFGRRFVRTFTEPLMEIVRGTQRIAGGAPELGYAPRDHELANLAGAIDSMAERIAEARGSLIREKEVVDRIVENITAGVVSVDREGRVLLLNRAAHELLGLAVGQPLIGALESREHLGAVAAFVRACGREPAQSTARLEGGQEEDGQWSLVWVPIETDGEPAALFVIEDVTEVLRAQRLEAWAEMARLIAHEVKNPLTPIRLSTEHLREVYRSRPQELDSVFERCTANILQQVEELRNIAADFSTYSRIPELKREPGDLAAEVRKLVEPYRSSPPPGVEVRFEGGQGPIEAEFDPRLVSRAIRNLIENAIRASEGGGVVNITVAATGSGAERYVEVRVEDDGPGVEPDLLPRIFEPYFSTEEQGTGLGLAIARKIAEEHDGEIRARNRAGGGLEVTLRLPDSGPRSGASPGLGT